MVDDKVLSDALDAFTDHCRRLCIIDPKDRLNAMRGAAEVIEKWVSSSYAEVEKSILDRALINIGTHEFTTYGRQLQGGGPYFTEADVNQILSERRRQFDPPLTLQQKISNKMHELEGESYETIAAQIVALIEKERADGK